MFLCPPSLSKGLHVVKPEAVDNALLAYRRVVLYMFALSHIGGD